MAEELAAESFSSDSGRKVQRGLGRTETSAPVSMRNVNLDEGSNSERRPFLLTPRAAATCLGAFSFLNLLKQFYF